MLIGNRFIRLIHNLKPSFEQDYLETVVAELEGKGYIDKRE